MAVIKAVSSKASIGKAIDYVEKGEKTEAKLLEGVGCSPSTATIEMQAVKDVWGKTEGRQYKHFVYSFPPGEKISLEQIRDNAKKLVEETTVFKGHQVLIAVHDDREHKHAHLIVNSVNAEDGHKLQWSKADLQNLKDRCNELSREQGLSIPEKGKNVTDWSLNKHKTLEKAFSGEYKSYLLDVANAVADVRMSARSRTEFVELMKQKDIGTEWKDNHKNITFKTAEGIKVRNSNLTKTFKADFGKESLEDEFQRNAKRSRIEDRAKEQLRDSAHREAKPKDSRATTKDIAVNIERRNTEASHIKAKRREREVARVKQERESFSTKVHTASRYVEQTKPRTQNRGYDMER